MATNLLSRRRLIIVIYRVGATVNLKPLGPRHRSRLGNLRDALTLKGLVQKHRNDLSLSNSIVSEPDVKLQGEF